MASVLGWVDNGGTLGVWVTPANQSRIWTESWEGTIKLGQLAGLDRTYISSVEAGRRNVSLKNIYRLAEALGVEARELLSG